MLHTGDASELVWVIIIVTKIPGHRTKKRDSVERSDSAQNPTTLNIGMKRLSQNCEFLQA